MTRVNLVPPAELADQHLFAEFRELKMVPKALARSLASGRPLVVPAEFTLGAGHVRFFYDKGAYLRARYAALREELGARGFNYNAAAGLDPLGVFVAAPHLAGDYVPTPAALALVRARIAERLAARPGWYRWTPRSRGFQAA